MASKFFARKASDRPTCVTVVIARQTVWLLGDETNGVQPGMFVTRLWRLMVYADQDNLELLRMVYPGYVEAFEAGMRTTWGLEWLRNKARPLSAVSS